VLAIHFAPDLEVNPVTQGWVNHELNRAKNDGYSAAVIVLDTPGGLSTSMRKIYQKELALPIPVIVYVAPDGARAGSAGLWIAEAADVLAMAPQTNIGASTPINAGGGNLDKDLRKKVVNDAAASVVALAKSHGRDTKFPERAVRQAASLPAPDALQQHVIDVIAPSLPALLRQLNGYKTKPKGYTLHLGGADIVHVKPGFFTRLLNTLIDPNIITLLFLAGIAGIGYEIFHPGVVLPGALGAVALITALFGFSILPVSWAAFALLLLGVGLLAIDVHVTSHGALTVAGLVCLAVGSIMLFHNAPPPYHTSKPLVIGVAVGLGAVWAFAVGKAWQVRGRPVQVGPQLIAGAVGEVRRDGLVFVNGELWQARATGGEQLRPGERVRVESLDGLVLTVRPEGTA
jgi:membrane-bound serine protease (ClpP class)